MSAAVKALFQRSEGWLSLRAVRRHLRAYYPGLRAQAGEIAGAMARHMRAEQGQKCLGGRTIRAFHGVSLAHPDPRELRAAWEGRLEAEGLEADERDAVAELRDGEIMAMIQMGLIESEWYTVRDRDNVNGAKRPRGMHVTDVRLRRSPSAYHAHFEAAQSYLVHMDEIGGWQDARLSWRYDREIWSLYAEGGTVRSVANALRLCKRSVERRLKHHRARAGIPTGYHGPHGPRL